MADAGRPDALSRLPDAVGSVFTFRWDPNLPGVDLTLVAFENRSGDARYRQSSAYFEGPSRLPLAQATYAVAHPVLGDFALFIVPVEQRDDMLRYEACITRER